GTYNQVLADQFTDAMRKLVNAIEVDLAITAKQGASRAYGSGSTVPFSSAGDLSDFADVAQILDQNGAPVVDRQLVLGYSAMGALRGKQSVLFKVNEAGSNDMLRHGITHRVQNCALRYASGVKQHAAGSATGFTANGDAAMGSRQVAIDGGTGSFVAGDVVHFGDDAGEQYIVNQAGSVITLNRPGLISNVAGGAAVGVAGNHTP